jgi:hypothetical protein
MGTPDAAIDLTGRTLMVLGALIIAGVPLVAFWLAVTA